MTVTLNIPESLSASLQNVWQSLPRLALDGFAVEAYRQGILSAKEVGILMDHSSRLETENFLSSHGAWPGTTAEEIAEDGSKLADLLAQ